MKPYLITSIAFFLCLACTPVVRFLAVRKGFVAEPTKDRWHKKPTALLGGIAIYLGIAVSLLFISDFKTIISHILRIAGPGEIPSIGAAVLIGATLVFILGLLDDFINIKPHTKLVGQILVASLMAFLGFRLHWFTSLTMDTLVTIFWIVGITNAFNLIDNMDGLCAGIGFVASVFLAYMYFGISLEAAYVAIILAGTLAGFLFYNFKPASIFMGDCGSLVIGFTLSILCLYYAEFPGINAFSVYVVPIMIMMVPILDTTLVTLIRLLSGRKASMGGKDHTSHRLVLMGLNERNAMLFLCGVGAVSGIAAVFVSRTDTLTSPAVIIPVGLSVLLMGIYLSQLRVYPEKEFSVLRDKPYTPILIELTYKRQMLLVMLDFFLISFAYYLSYRLRFDSKAFGFYFKIFLQSLPAVIVCKFIAFFWMGIYRSIWNYLSTNDVYVYLKASLIGTIFSVVTITYIYRFEHFSKGIFLIDLLLTAALLLGTRGSFRIFMETIKRKTLTGNSVLIYGAGRGGEILLREILNNKKLKIKPVGFIDDDKTKTGKRLQGYPILGTFNDLESLDNKYNFSGLLVSFYNNQSINLNDIKSFCKAKNMFLKQFSIHIDEVEFDR